MLISSRLTTASLLITLAACTASTPAAAPVDVAALKDTIQAREREWSAKFLAADAAGLATLYTEDAATVPASGDWTTGRDAIAKSMQPDFDSVTYTAREDITEEVIPVGPNYAFEVGHYNSTGTSKATGEPRTASGRYIVLWRRDTKGTWRLHRDMGTDVPATP